MYGDTAVIRKRAGQLREQAGELRALGDTLVAQAEALDWNGRAAESMRDRVRDRAAQLREAAHRHEDAAQSLDRHLQAADGVKEQIAEHERRIDGLILEARQRVAAVEAAPDVDGVRIEPLPADVELASLETPQSGHLDWLSISVPDEEA